MSISTINLLPLLDASTSSSAAAAVDLRLLSGAKNVSKADPTWPIHTFLVGEVHRLRNERADAQSAYRDLVEWAAADPDRDGWGGSSIAGIALWRRLQEVGSQSSPDPKEVDRLLVAAEKLRSTRLFRGLFADPYFSNASYLEEDITRRLALLARSVGRKEDALRLFLDYLSICRTAELGPVETELKDQLVSSGQASADRLTLFRGKRLLSIGSSEAALALLTEARQSNDPQVRAEAGLYLARVQRIQGTAKRTERAQLLASVVSDATDPEVIQQALMDRSLLLNREGAGQDAEQSLKDLLQLLDRFPHGREADAALYELARRYQDGGDLDTALSYYVRLRSFPGPNRYFESAAYQPALALYGRAGSDDVASAGTLLQELEKQEPSGPVHSNALFWLGRIAEERGDTQEAGSYFRKVIEDSPYNYYAIRARMHVRLGRLACKQFWPDEGTIGDLGADYERSKIDTSLPASSPYHVRLRNALETGLYAASQAADSRMREAFPSRRLEELTAKEIENTGLLTPLSLWLALRQDAMAAKDAVPSAANRLQIAAAVGQTAKDWTVSTLLVTAPGEPHEVQAAIQRDPRYLATAYPAIYEDPIRKSGATYHVRPELLYSVMRHESAFYPAALSKQGALGLFQFTPSTFDALNGRWKLLDSSGVKNRESFLLRPDLSIALGARWFQEEFFKNNGGDLLLSMMAHNAGAAAVRDWVTQWKNGPRKDDLEYFSESIRINETRTFVRNVFATLVIADAAGFLKGGNPDGP